ncbi:MAG: adenosylmethionine decarboxylase [Burkholderiales bacterium]|nr:adenosylmethionine decarboxylase [Burkholderiales bacterium]
MHGLHLTADLRGCDAALPPMTEPAALRALCLGAVQGVGLQPVGELFHRFTPRPGSVQPTGITGVVLLAESHLAVHTWPELGAVTLDVYVCNLGADHSTAAEALLAALQRAFAPAEAQVQRLQRGQALGAGAPAAEAVP